MPHLCYEHARARCMKFLLSKPALEMITETAHIRDSRNYGSFPDVVQRAFVACDEISIAVGYIGVNSVTHLIGLVERNRVHSSVNVYVGMPLGKSTRVAAEQLDKLLQRRGLGKVYETTMEFHGKVYLFKDNGRPIIATVGSSNLTGIVKSHPRLEVDIQIDDQQTLTACESIFHDLVIPISVPVGESNERSHKQTASTEDLAEDTLQGMFSELVSKIDEEELAEVRLAIMGDKTFIHRFRCSEKQTASNLNKFFSVGRKSKRKDGTEVEIPRPWYEVEAILPEAEREDPNAPPNLFTVVTDDGHVFEMGRRGDYDKNLESRHNLQVFGYWVKRKLEDSGVLKPGDLITDATLAAYGNENLKLTPIDDNSGRWYMDFSPSNQDD